MSMLRRFVSFERFLSLSFSFAKQHIKDKVVIAFKQLRNRKYINYKQAKPTCEDIYYLGVQLTISLSELQKKYLCAKTCARGKWWIPNADTRNCLFGVTLAILFGFVNNNVKICLRDMISMLRNNETVGMKTTRQVICNFAFATFSICNWKTWR